MIFLFFILAPLLAFGGVAASNPKRGIAWSSKTPGDMLWVTNSAISWEYGWNVEMPNPSVVEHVPMLWGSQHADNFATKVFQLQPKVVLGMNEPELGSQSNLPVDKAVELWKSRIQPLKAQNIKLGSPGISSAPHGKQWLKEFLDRCTGCTVDFICIHWYGEGAENFIRYIQEIHALFPQYPIWVTEFSETRADRTVILKFMDTTIRWLDQQSYVERYAWFIMARQTPDGLQGHLMDGDGSLNSLGRRYLEVL